jgi:hypothetical protein
MRPSGIDSAPNFVVFVHSSLNVIANAMSLETRDVPIVHNPACKKSAARAGLALHLHSRYEANRTQGRSVALAIGLHAVSAPTPLSPALVPASVFRASRHETVVTDRIATCSFAVRKRSTSLTISPQRPRISKDSTPPRELNSRCGTPSRYFPTLACDHQLRLHGTILRHERRDLQKTCLAQPAPFSSRHLLHEGAP